MKKNLILLLTIVAIIILLAGIAFIAINKKDKETEIPTTVNQTESQNLSLSNNCKNACDNYVNHCLTKVPNATHVLFEEGRESCMQECSKWDNQKTSCIAEVNTCEAMTLECKL